MKRWMFNELFGLQQAVIDGAKTMLRRVVSDKLLLDAQVYSGDSVRKRDKEVMKETKSGVVTDGIYIRFDDKTWIDLDPSMSLNPAFDVKDGERVKVIIIKED